MWGDMDPESCPWTLTQALVLAVVVLGTLVAMFADLTR